ncbi:hypothetical protein [Pseudomonas wadenswilerensis]|nr:hypothetical protein [Pseudomonas wadenswilerensis]
MSDFQTTTEPVARKRHSCCECRGHIEPGHKYQLTAGCWEGDMSSFKTCLACVEARDWATAQPEWCGDGEHLFYFGMLEEDLSYLAPEIAPGDGRRFKAHRLQSQIVRRRLAAKSKQAA